MKYQQVKICSFVKFEVEISLVYSIRIDKRPEKWNCAKWKSNRRNPIIKFSIRESSSRQMNWIIYIVICRRILKCSLFQLHRDAIILSVCCAGGLPPFNYVSNTQSNSCLFSIQQIQYQLHGERLAMWFANP